VWAIIYFCSEDGDEHLIRHFLNPQNVRRNPALIVLAGMRTFKNAAGELEADFHVGQSLRNGKTIEELRKTK